MKDTRFISSLGACILALSLTLAACGGGGGSSDTGSGGVADKPIAPSITTPPASQSVVAGKTATFSVVATGGATLAYQWKKNGTDISGATSSSYTTPTTSSADNGAIFLVSVSNSAGTVTSSSATLAVSAAPVAPVISTQPVNQSVVVGQSATFSVVATGGGTITYQWKKNGTDISGATNSTYTKPATAIGDSGAVFTVVVSNAAGPVTSTEATLTVTAEAVKPSITGQPYAKPVTAGQTATFTVEATGTSPLRYQWKKNGTDIADATSSTYTTPATSLADSGTEYSVVVSNDVGTATSSVGILTVTSVPIISTQPAAQTVTAGKTATFSVTAAGTAPLSYQWKKGGTDISGATASTYTTPATVIGDNNALYSVVVSNSLGTVTSNTATLTVNQRYSLVPNGASTYALTECVKDNSTGLIWEGKTASGSRLGTSTYTNYDDASSAQKWVGGGTYVNPTQADIDASTNSIGYKNAVNTSALCGYTDWRLPTEEELQGIVASSGNPKIDTTWFPNTRASWYWTSSPYVGYSGIAWSVNFYYGVVGGSNRDDSYLHVRLVR